MQNQRTKVKSVRNARQHFPVCALLALILAGTASLAHAQGQKPLLLRDPSDSKTQIAFSYAGNIWIANRDGGNLRRLTSGGHEHNPFFSPDGAQIAFTGDYDGTRGVYVVAADGGEPRRHVLLVDADGADQHIEAAPLCGDFDATIDDVQEEEALLLVLEGHLAAAPEDDGDHLFEVAGERSRGAVGHEAKRPHGA